MSVKFLLRLAQKLQAKYANSRLEVDLLPPKEIVGDDFFDFRIDRLQEVINFFPKLWAPEFQEEFAGYVKGALQRGEEQIKKEFKSIRHGKHDVVLTLKRTPAGSVHLRGDTRYSNEPMAKYLLDSTYDLVPPVVGSTGMGNHLLDGHHRWRAYLLAGLAPLILEIKIEPSKGDVPKAVAIVDESALNKK